MSGPTGEVVAQEAQAAPGEQHPGGSVEDPKKVNAARKVAARLKGLWPGGKAKGGKNSEAALKDLSDNGGEAGTEPQADNGGEAGTEPGRRDLSEAWKKVTKRSASRLFLGRKLTAEAKAWQDDPAHTTDVDRHIKDLTGNEQARTSPRERFQLRATAIEASMQKAEVDIGPRRSIKDIRNDEDYRDKVNQKLEELASKRDRPVTRIEQALVKGEMLRDTIRDENTAIKVQKSEIINAKANAEAKADRDRVAAEAQERQEKIAAEKAAAEKRDKLKIPGVNAELQKLIHEASMDGASVSRADADKLADKAIIIHDEKQKVDLEARQTKAKSSGAYAKAYASMLGDEKYANLDHDSFEAKAMELALASMPTEAPKADESGPEAPETSGPSPASPEAPDASGAEPGAPEASTDKPTPEALMTSLGLDMENPEVQKLIAAMKLDPELAKYVPLLTDQLKAALSKADSSGGSSSSVRYGILQIILAATAAVGITLAGTLKLAGDVGDTDK